MDQITGFKCKLESYQLRAVTEGEDALGEVTVRVSNEGITMLGKGVSTDIIEASCLAYLNAANRVIEARQEREKRPSVRNGSLNRCTNDISSALWTWFFRPSAWWCSARCLR